MDIKEVIEAWKNGKKDAFEDYVEWLYDNPEVKALEDAGLSDDDYSDKLDAIEEALFEKAGVPRDVVGKMWNDYDKLYPTSDNPVTSEIIIDKDDDGDADVTITKQDDGDDKKPESDEPHDEGLAGDTTPEEEAMLKLAAGESEPSTELTGDTTLEEDLMLNPGMSPSEFSKKAAEKRGAKPGEPAPDFNNFTNDIARNLASRRW